jgi:hypothetical protein
LNEREFLELQAEQLKQQIGILAHEVELRQEPVDLLRAEFDKEHAEIHKHGVTKAGPAWNEFHKQHTFVPKPHELPESFSVDRVDHPAPEAPSTEI